MKVKYATQIFSKTVSAAIRTASKAKELENFAEFADSTATFFSKIKYLFHVFNVRKLNFSQHNSSYKNVLHGNNTLCLNFLNEIKNLLQNSIIMNDKCRLSGRKTGKKHGMLGN